MEQSSNMLNLQEIFSFIEVSKAKGFSNASRKTGLPKSTLSRHVQNLEERLALHLFQRSTRKLTLTAAGEAFLQKAQGLISQFESLEKQFQSQSRKLEGVIRITCAVEVGHYLLPDILSSFKEKHPGITFDLFLSDDATNLIDSKIDLAIRSGSLEDSSIVCKKWKSSGFKLYCSVQRLKNFEKLDRKSLPLIDYVKKPFHKTEFVSGKKSFIFDQHPVYSTNSLRMNAELAELGEGLCALPSFMGDRYVEQGRLTPFKKEWASALSPLHLLYLPQSYLPLRMRAFLDHLSKD